MNEMLKTYCWSTARQEKKFKTRIEKVLVNTYYPCEVYNSDTDVSYGVKWLTIEDMRKMRVANSDVDYIEINDRPRHEYKDVEVNEPDWRSIYDRLTDQEISDIKKYGFTDSDFKNLTINMLS